MSVLSTVSCALLSAVTAFAIVTAAGCGTDAKGVDDCRDIEEARCSAAKNCNLISVSVSECQTFYRDQCLHGLAVNPPGSAVISRCVATIRAAGLCALQGTDTAPNDCNNPPISASTTAQTTCQIVSNPEETTECSFLMPTADAGAADAGGSGGSGGMGATAGSGGGGGTTETTDAGGSVD